jgi:uroporphyrin-III C-methyltransferase/precorrin-2 dehydrogenase/sirohydrochlorin ferrochelatase
MDYLPIFFNIKDKPCLVVGGGEIAFRKINLLLKANAEVTCLAINCCNNVAELVSKNQIKYINKEFDPSDISNQYLIISATDDALLNEQVSQLANIANIPVNVVDSPALCSFIMPSIVDRSPIVIAISSAGKAPVLVRLIRAKLESTIPHAYGKLAEFCFYLISKIAGQFS